MNRQLPLSRFENIVVQELNDEILVCDLKNNRVLCLNQTAAEVWKLCTGEKDVKTISQILSRKLNSNVSEEMILFSLDELSKNNLLIEKISTNEYFKGISRREIIRKIGLGSMVALPLITSVVMPKAVQAQSCGGTFAPDGCACTIDNDCDSNCCQSSVCVSSNSNGCFCPFCATCDSGCCINGVCTDVSICRTNAKCGVSLTCPSGFFCCNPTSPTNTGSCSACGC